MGNYTAGDKICDSYLGSRMTGAMTRHIACKILQLRNARMKVAVLFGWRWDCWGPALLILI